MSEYPTWRDWLAGLCLAGLCGCLWLLGVAL